jgi:uncharacterized repeat protein (TIGR01451 family)/fimbrial isopeptide formation D2 family protein
MKYFSKKYVPVLLYAALAFGASEITYAAETVCNDNGGVGWPFAVSSTTNINIPYQFADVSVAFDVDVSVDITKAYVGDLTSRITSPQGTTVWLFERPGTVLDENTATAPWGCAQNDIVATFDDEAAIGTDVENVCGAGTPTINGTYLPHVPTAPNIPSPNVLSLIDGEDPTGNWGFELVHVAPFDPGTLNEVCITAAFAAVTFDKWVSTNNTCTDTLDSISVAPGTDVYFCYTANNPGTETFNIVSGDATDSQGHDISALETSYVQNASQTVVVGPIVAGSAALPNAATTVNNASIIATFATANFTGTLSTGEAASASVGDPVLNTSTKTVVDLNGGSVAPGDVLEYTVTINETAGFTTTDITVTDVVQAELQSINFTSLPAGTTNNTVGNNIDLSTITVAAGSSVTIVYEATIDAAAPPGTNIDNTATITHAGSGVTFDAISPTLTISPTSLSTSTKTVLDVNGGSLLPGDLLRYTITIIETGGLPVSNVQLTDVVDANLTGINITNLGGGTDNSAGNTIDISNISIPASSSVTVEFEANVSGAASTGTSINNTAIITDVTTGIVTNAVAPTVVVNSTPSSGTKILYLDNLGGNAGDLTRDDPATITDSRTANLNGNGESADFNLTPVFQGDFTISAGTINALIGFERNNNGGSRTVLIELYKVSGGNTLIASDSTTFNIGTNQGNTTLIPFDFTLASAVSFTATDSLMMRVTNTTGPSNNRVRVHSNLNGLSVIPFDTATVINLDEVGIYAAASPSTTQYKSYLPGSTVYLRAKVSDPFGYADINSVDFTVSNPVPTQVFSTSVSVPVADPAAAGATAVFETPYTIPATPDGIWSVGFTANEGSEGTVTHSSTANIVVGPPLLTVSKNYSQTLFDPVNTSNYKAIPNSIVEYSVGVENTGYGYVDINTIVLTDTIAAGTTFYFGSPLNPATFVDGLTASGLSFTFISLASTLDDIDFSNDGGATYITPAVDANGFDITSPPINHIRLSPKGEFRGSDGANDPSMVINFRVRVE